jgi:mono/diheme cytochrome c family protein
MEQSGDRVSVVFGFEGQKGMAELQLQCLDKEVLLKGPFRYPDRSGDWVFTKLKNAKTALSGQKLFDTNCAICHFHDRQDQKVGPGLAGLFKKPKLPSGRPATDEKVQEQIVNGGDKMPPFKHLKDDEVQAIIDYLKGL